MKRIVIDARESGTSTGRYIDKLIENLHSLKPDIDFVILTKSHRLSFIKAIAPNFEVVECNIKEFSITEQLKYAWQLYRLKKDLVHFGKTEQPVLYFGQSLTTIHDLTTAYFRNLAKNRWVFWFKQRVYRWVIKRVAKKSAHLIVPSEYVKEQLADFAHIAPDKISVVYEAADTITAKPQPFKNLKAGGFIMYVGRPQLHKNLERLVEAFAVLRQDHPELKLVLAGRKDRLYEQLQEKVREKGIRGVIFTGFVSEGSLRWLYENTGAYVFPSLSEGFGLPGLEAMSHGAPVAASRATSLPEIYGQGAIYFDPLDVSDTAAKINQLLSDQKLAARVSAAGRKQAAKYSWQATAKQTLAVYKKLT